MRCCSLGEVGVGISNFFIIALLCGDICCDCVVVEVLKGGIYPGCGNNGGVNGIAHDIGGNFIASFATKGRPGCSAGP